MKYQLIIIDDEAPSRITLSNCFPWEQFGFQVVGQSSCAQDALKLLDQYDVDVVMCDIRLPGMNGIELVKILNSRTNSPVVVLFSGYRDFEYAHQAINLGIRHYLLKPITYEDLVETFTALKSELDKKYRIIHEEKAESSQDQFVSTVHAYVDKNIDTANLKELSDYLHMNASYVSQLYKKRTGCNFSDYLLEARMRKAVHLLTSSSQKIASVGAAVGYDNAKSFSRIFLSYHGKTPSEYRHAHNLTRFSKEDSP